MFIKCKWICLAHCLLKKYYIQKMHTFSLFMHKTVNTPELRLIISVESCAFAVLIGEDVLMQLENGSSLQLYSYSSH